MFCLNCVTLAHAIEIGLAKYLDNYNLKRKYNKNKTLPHKLTEH